MAAKVKTAKVEQFYLYLILFQFHYCVHLQYLAVALTCYPVNSDSFHPANAISDHILSPGLVSLGPADGA